MSGQLAASCRPRMHRTRFDEVGAYAVNLGLCHAKLVAHSLLIYRFHLDPG